jgi:hypothetical protein
MIIDNNVLAISKCMFQERKNWKFVTDEQKSEYFFIFNRYFSKKYPYLAQLLNDKTTNKVAGMDLWFYFMEGKPYPKWFWSKSEKSKDDYLFTEKEVNSLLNKFDIKQEELDLLIKYHLDDVREELKYIKDGEKGNK